MKNPLRRAKSTDAYRDTKSSSKVSPNHEPLSRTHSESTQKSGLFDKLRTRIRRPSFGFGRGEQDDHEFLHTGNRTAAAPFVASGIGSSGFSSSPAAPNSHSALRGRRSIPIPLMIHAENERFTPPFHNSVRSMRQQPLLPSSESPEKSLSPTTPPKVPERSLVSLGLVPLSATKSSTPSPKMTSSQSQYEIPLHDSPLSPLSPFLCRQAVNMPTKAGKPLPPLPVGSFDDLHPGIPEVAEEDAEIPPEELAPAPPTPVDLEYRPDHESFSVTAELRRLYQCGWYWGPISRSEAEKRMEHHPDGAFLVRNSHDPRHLLTLTFRSLSKTLHARIDYENGRFSFHPQLDHEAFPSVVELVENAMKKATVCYSRSREPDSPTFPVQLARPVSRFNEVSSLKYLCRFVIRLHVRADHLADTPLPDSIRQFLSTLNS